MMLRKLRITSAIIVLAITTFLFLDYTGTVHQWLGWIAKAQFFFALLTLNAGLIAGLILLTLLFGRIYCSVICPLGILQDGISRIASTRTKHRFSYSPAKAWLRYAILGLFILAFITGIGWVVALLEPYSLFGRIISNLLTPVYQWGNNLLAYLAERADSYAFYRTEVWIKGIGTFITVCVSFVLIIYLAWKNGRTYCNTVCPVGTVLGFLSRFSLYKPQIDTDKCNGCGLCARNCKAACINPKDHSIDYSRCVDCFDCLENCKRGAIRYERRKPVYTTDKNRRRFLTLSAALTSTAIMKAQEKKVDGGLAEIKEKQIPKRNTAIAPPGAVSLRNFSLCCTGCQLCISVCPNQVLRPSGSLETFMEPQVSYERGYCRPECVKCSEVCPSGAIRPITKADKSAIQTGHAVWIEKNCIVLCDDVNCGNCARHCPANAIEMVEKEPGRLDSLKIPVINTERCIGCGACENLCPARPFSAIYVEGHSVHRII